MVNIIIFEPTPAVPDLMPVKERLPALNTLNTTANSLKGALYSLPKAQGIAQRAR